MFTLVIRKVFHPRVPLKRIHILCIIFTRPKKSHFHCLQSLTFDDVVCDANSCCVITMLRFFGCLSPRSLRVSLIIIPSWQYRKSAPSSASAADATTNRRIAHNVWNVPFSLMDFPLIGNAPMKKCPHPLLRAFSLLKYEASEWMFMTMSNAQNCTVAFGCVAK